jgi:FkbM family methyltransferase
MALIRRALGAASRRLDRPELLAAVYRGARQAEHEAIGTAAVLAGVLRADSVYVDVGANRGQVLADAVRVAPRARHIAFEPIPSVAEELAARFEGVVCRAVALGARAEVTKFCHFTKLDGWSGLRRNAEISDERGGPELIDVEVSTLDAELADLIPTVVKIDVEGAELDVLRGGRSLLSRTRPVLIFEHVSETASAYGATSEDLWDLLAELGYAIFTVTGAGPFTRSAFAAETTAVNWLARPGDPAR